MAPATKSFHLPAFQSKDVRFWFLQVEATFRTNNVKDQQVMFDSVITALDVNAASDIADILETPPEETPYDKLKEALLSRLAISNAARIKRVLSNLAIGDRTPSQHLRRLRSEAGNNFSEEVLQTIWLDSLPADVKLVISGTKNLPLDQLAEMADRVHEVAAPRRSIAAVSSPASSSAPHWQTQIDALTKPLAAVVKQLDGRGRKASRTQSSAGPAAKRPRSRSPSVTQDEDADDAHCWYHRRFKEKARKCIKPCTASWPLSKTNSSSGNGPAQQ